MSWRTFIDVSKWQGEIDWDVMAASGVDAVYMRAYNGLTKDKKLDQYAENARRVGLPFGLYTFWRPKYGAAEQVAKLLQAHAATGASLIPMIDVEHGDEKPPTDIGRSVTQGVRLVEKHLGVSPVIYTAAWFWNPAVKGAAVGHCPLWLARYSVPDVPHDPKEWADHAMRYKQPVVPNDWSQWDAWQFSAEGNFRGHVYGVSSTPLDLNIMRGEAWDRFVVEKKPAEPPAPPAIDYDRSFKMRMVVPPVRVYDSRHAGAHAKGESRRIRLDTVDAAFVNITVIDQGGGGWLTAWGHGNMPVVSNVNWGPGTTIANTSWVPVVDGHINVFTSAACHVLVDLQASS